MMRESRERELPVQRIKKNEGDVQSLNPSTFSLRLMFLESAPWDGEYNIDLWPSTGS